MAKVTGIGGIFLKCRDVEQTRGWYAKHLGIQMDEWGGVQLNWADDPHPQPYSILGFFRRGSEYFAPSESMFMLNLRVDDLDALLQQLKSEGIEPVGEPMEEEYGKFAWIMDPEGNKVELWQQK